MYSPRLALFALMSVLALCACLDVTPTSERARVTVLVPDLMQAGLSAALQSYRDLQPASQVAVRSGGDAELARLAVAEAGEIALTAHPAFADYVASRIAVNARRVVARDRLVVIGPGGGRLDRAPADLGLLLAGPETIGIPSTESDAVGMYAREALLRYGIWTQIQPRLRAFATEANALGALAQGAVGATFTTASRAAGRGDGVLVAIDPAFHRPIALEALLLPSAEADAQALFEYLTSGTGLGSFVSQGFLPPAPQDG